MTAVPTGTGYSGPQIPKIREVDAELRHKWNEVLKTNTPLKNSSSSQVRLCVNPSGDKTNFDWQLIISGEKGSCLIYLGKDIVERLVRLVDPMLELALLDSEELSLSLEYLFSDTLNRFEKEIGFPIHVTGINRCIYTNQSEDLDASLMISEGKKWFRYPISMRVESDEADWWYSTLDGLSLVVPEDRNSAAIEKMITAELKTGFGPFDYTLGEIEKLNEGDVFVLGKIEEQPRFIQADKDTIWPVELTEQSLRVSGRPITNFPRSPGMDQKNLVKKQDNQQDVTIADMPIKLTFEVGSKTISVSDLRQIQEGKIVDIPDASIEAVTIVANGTAIGSGELLQVGDELGLKITKISRNA